MAHGDKDKKKRLFVSKNSDNRHFCVAIQRQKFCYETYEKAVRACQFSDNQQRVYYCPFCCAYHTTHFLSKKGYIESPQAKTNKAVMDKINKAVRPNDEKYMDPTIRRVRAAKYNFVIEELLTKHIEKHLEDSALSMMEITEWFDKKLKIKNDKYAKKAIEEVLKWPFYKYRVAFKAFVLFYIEFVGGIYAKSLMDFVFDITTDEMPDKDKKKLGYFFKQYYENGKLVITEVTSGGYMKYELASENKGGNVI